MSNFKDTNFILSFLLYCWTRIVELFIFTFSFLKMPILTGIRYPNIPLLRGYTPLGRVSDFDKIANQSGLWEVVLEAGELAKKHSSGMCYFWGGSSTMLLITKPNHIKQFIWQNFGKGSFMRSGIGEIIGHDNQILLPNNELWRKKDRALKKWIAYDKQLDKLLPGMLDLADEYLEKVQAEKTTNLKEFSQLVSVDSINKLVLGLHSIKEHHHEILSTLDNVFNLCSSTLSQIMFNFLVRFQDLGLYKSKFSLQREAMLNLFNKRLIEPKLKTLLQEDNFIREIVYTYDNGKSVTEVEEVYNDGCMLMLSGSGPTATVLQTVIMLLIKHPPVLTKLKEEIVKSNLPSKNSDWTKQQLDGLQYLDCIIKETLRLYPPLPFIARTAESSFTFINEEVKSLSEYRQLLNDKNRDTSTDVILNLGDTVFISSYLTQHLESSFKDPDKFIPERFYNIEQKTFMDYSYFPFGLSTRDCPGKNFAIQQIKAAVIKAFTKCNIEHDQEYHFKYHGESTLQYNSKVNASFKAKSTIKVQEEQIETVNIVLKNDSIDREINLQARDKPQEKPRQIPK